MYHHTVIFLNKHHRIDRSHLHCKIAIKIRRQGKTVLEEQRQTVDVTVPLSAMPTADTPLHRTITISTKGNLRGELKVVVYDYAADRLGTATTTIR